MPEVDRIAAQEIADMLGVIVSAIPTDFDTLTAQLWQVSFGDDPMPESPETRWELVMALMVGLI